MKNRAILTILSLMLISTSNAFANDGKYTLSYQDQNKWVAKQDINPLRQAIVFFSNNNLKVKAICSEADTFCKDRIEIVNHIFKKQKVNKDISIIEKSKSLDKNKLQLQSIDLDSSKYVGLFLNYDNNKTEPTKKSVADLAKFLKNSDLKYLSQFKMYCNSQNKLCKDRFIHITSVVAKSLPFKFNIKLYVNANLEPNQAQLINHRHDYNISPALPKPIETGETIKKEVEQKIKQVSKTKPAPKPKAKPVKKQEKIIYTNDEKTIVFKANRDELLDSEKPKVERFIKNSLNNKFNFACDNANAELCRKRVHSIKDYALRKTSNIIEMYQITNRTYKDHIIIYHKQ